LFFGVGASFGASAQELPTARDWAAVSPRVAAETEFPIWVGDVGGAEADASKQSVRSTEGGFEGHGALIADFTDGAPGLLSKEVGK